jgi:hypothetical protein
LVYVLKIRDSHEPAILVYLGKIMNKDDVVFLAYPRRQRREYIHLSDPVVEIPQSDLNFPIGMPPLYKGAHGPFFVSLGFIKRWHPDREIQIGLGDFYNWVTEMYIFLIHSIVLVTLVFGMPPLYKGAHGPFFVSLGMLGKQHRLYS